MVGELANRERAAPSAAEGKVKSEPEPFLLKELKPLLCL